jgi:hypothetical protein
MTVPGISRPAFVVIVVAAVALFVFGAGEAAGLLTQHTDTQTRTFAAAPIVVVTTRNADVKIVAADRSDVRLTTKEKRSMFGGGRVSMHGDASGLNLGDSCHGLPVIDDPCHVSVRLEVPRGTAVRVTSGTGDVRVENLGGGAALSSATGDLHVIGVRGYRRRGRGGPGAGHLRADGHRRRRRRGQPSAHDPRRVRHGGHRLRGARPDLRRGRPVGRRRRQGARARRQRLPAEAPGALEHRGRHRDRPPLS